MPEPTRTPDRIRIVIIADRDAARAARRALEHTEATGERTAVWVGDDADPELAELGADLARRP